jgi:hypothetical protein
VDGQWTDVNTSVVFSELCPKSSCSALLLPSRRPQRNLAPDAGLAVVSSLLTGSTTTTRKYFL